METNKEFITRMYMLVNELPKDKIEDYENILSLISFQLKSRDIDHISDFVKDLTFLFNSSHAASTAKHILHEKLKSLREKTRYTFKIPEDNKESDQQILGSEGNKENPDNLKH